MYGFKYRYFSSGRPAPVDQLLIWSVNTKSLKLRRYFNIEIQKLQEKSEKARTRHNITIDGVTMSALAWAKKNGITGAILNGRLRTGWNPVDAVTIKNGRAFMRGYECDGEKHTVTEWAKLKGLNVYTLFRRINEGWPIDRALSEPIEHVKFKRRDARRAEIEERKWRKFDLPVLKMDRLKKALTS